MNIKSLLLGSAAVLVAVSGARAADAIVVEAEPVEYVRICDAYGKGWFYIPGTETCLKFDGDVRVQYGSTHYHDEVDDETSLHEANYRARLNVRANNETEYGTLASRIRFSADSVEGGHDDLLSRAEGPGSAATLVDIAVISLAGFRIGFDDTYWSTAGGYGYYQARFDGPYGFTNGLFFDYTYSANGFAATVGIEDGNISGESGAPDLYAGLTYSGNNWYLAGLVYHDSSAEFATAPDVASDGNLAYKIRADYNFGNGFNLGGWWMADGGDTDYVKGHAYGVTASYQLTETLLLFAGYGEYADQYNATGDTITPAAVDPTIPGFTAAVVATQDFDESFGNATVGLAWNVVPGLLIQPEYTTTWFSSENAAASATAGGVRTNNGRFSLRIVREF